MSRPTRVLYWFRTDLRLHDSPALNAALTLSSSPTCLYCVWTWDPHYVYSARVGANRWSFLLDCQSTLSASLTALNPNQKLLVVRESPTTVLPKLLKKWGITHLVFEGDPDWYARQRDEQVVRDAEALGVEVVVKSGRTLWDSREVVERHGGPTMTVASLMSTGKKIGPVPKPLPVPTSLPDPGDTDLTGVEQDIPSEGQDLNASARIGDEGDKAYSYGLGGPIGDFSVPTLAECSLQQPTTPHRGGETFALQTLRKVLADEAYVAGFAKPDTAPTVPDPAVNGASTTLLSAHLHFGSLGVREFYWGVQRAIDEYHKKAIGGKKKAKEEDKSERITGLLGQLYFRDMYFAAYYAIGQPFDRTAGNPYIKFVDWHLPSPPLGLRTDSNYRRRASLTGDTGVDVKIAEEYLDRWKHGRTGFPWIDAVMRQLKQEGWIHHLARHAVACFLTRGGCYISWERGAEVFEEWLIDHEAACNLGNWQWLSCTAFYSQYFRLYSPISFPKKTDPTGKFVRFYCPELKRLPDKFVYEPWKAPKEVLRNAGVVLGDSYPRPIFDFDERRKICLRGMKTAYNAGIRGSDECVVKEREDVVKDLLEEAKGGEGFGEVGVSGGKSGGNVGSGDGGGKEKRVKGKGQLSIEETMMKRRKKS